ncbi:penicillin-binding protein 2 [Actinocorallia longicatena]|uniref:Penicillin-binding transpeptidase domain-containing protein n=1 Tax=Actinocorallia longicatena TaxID=111803 RepID=A0ABP6Q940_9ACTN
MSNGNTMDKQLRRVAIVGLGLLGVLAININYIQGSQAEKLQKNALNTRQFQDIFLRDRGDIISADGVVLAFSDPLSKSNKPKYQRKYVQDGEAFVPVTGFFAGTLQKSGLEVAYDSYLDGKDKSQNVGKWLDQLSGKKPSGSNVITTIDAKAQRVAYQAIQKTVRRSSAIVIDIKTGAIKVAASFPSFDPNTVANVNKAEDDQKVLTKLNADKQGTPLINKAFGEVFPPGSSFKAVVAASFLQNGNNKNSTVPSPETQVPPGASQPVKNDCSGNPTVLLEAFAQSCNNPFGLMGTTSLLGNEKVGETARDFGFYEKIPIEEDLSAPASQYPVDQDTALEYFASFGQGETKTTTLQMAMVASAIANGGNLMKPYLVESVKNQKGDEIYSVDKKTMSKPLSSDSASDLQDMMRAVVDHGTARDSVGGQNIAGKTGTAELTETLRGLWFVGFAPSNNPKYAFAVQIEGRQGQFGASTAGPIAAQITQALLNK